MPRDRKWLFDINAIATYRLSIYDQDMSIQSFKCADTRCLFERRRVKCFVWTADGPTDVEIVDYH
ncbi:hypothetical protein CKO29_10725 [Allochromatium vinosum]|nr:hypothetical protein [Allochromatium vinosum]